MCLWFKQRVMNNTMKRLIFLFAVLFQVSSSQGQTLRFFEFGFRSDTPDSMNVVAATTDTAVIAKALSQLALPEAERLLFINGEIQYGTNTNNPLYTWHFVSNAWDLVETAIEVCDGTPDYVESDKDYWIKQVGRFCPYTSFTKREVTPSDAVSAGADKRIRMYPNPASDVLYITSAPQIAIREVTLLDALGKFVAYFSTSVNTINLASLGNGSYYLLIRHTAGNSIFHFVKH